jgi:hypothetical protein
VRYRQAVRLAGAQPLIMVIPHKSSSRPHKALCAGCAPALPSALTQWSKGGPQHSCGASTVSAVGAQPRAPAKNVSSRACSATRERADTRGNGRPGFFLGRSGRCAINEQCVECRPLPRTGALCRRSVLRDACTHHTP